MNDDKTPEFDAQRKCKSLLATRAILYTDTINGVQTCRDDMWAVTTDELNAITVSVPMTSSAGENFYRGVIEQVCEGGDISADVRKTLEAALLSPLGPVVSASAESVKEPNKRRLRGVVSNDSPFVRAHRDAAAAIGQSVESQKMISMVAAMYDANDCAEARAVDANDATAQQTVMAWECDPFLRLLLDDCAQMVLALRGIIDAHDDEAKLEAIQFAESVLSASSVPHEERGAAK